MNRTRHERGTDPEATTRSSRPGWNVGARSGMTWPPALPFDQALKRAQASDQQAMGMIYKRFLPVVYRFALGRVGDVHAAEDITSETFFVVVERIRETRAHDELTFVAWALGIARNQIAMHFRRLKTRPTTQLSDENDIGAGRLPSERDPLDVITARESLAEVVTALDKLTEEQRSVILYRCVLGYSAEDVGQLLGKQAGAVRALQFRALASLARLLNISEPTSEQMLGHLGQPARYGRRAGKEE